MGIGITDEHLALATSARRFIETHCIAAAARAGMDADADALPPFWDDLAGLGWLGIHLREDVGGEGFGLAELAVVVEELGRSAAPGPFLPSVLAAAVIERGGSPRLREEVLPGLAAGTSVGAVAFPGSSRVSASSSSSPGRRGSGEITLSGTARPIPGACVADWLVVACEGAGDGGEAGDVWCVVPAGSAEVVELASLDPTRRCGAVTVTGVPVDGDHQLRLASDEVRSLVGALVAAECAGGAAWCLDTATSYAKVREQFGRPIGQFQAVKHRCADMLVAVEQARAAAWDASVAFDGPWGNEAELAASVACACAVEGFLRVSKDCIQVLGGIGFTWEHDAHRFLRRAAANELLMGGPGQWRRRIAALALAGTRRRLAYELPDVLQADEVRADLRAEVEAVAARPDSDRRAALVSSGLFVPHWPPPWGRDASPAEQLVIDEELRRARLRRPHLAVGAWAAATVAAHGTPEQQERWVGPTLLGEISWCQLFSEPGAGSDLASLSTKAQRTSGGWLLTGQKVWTSMAAEADWGICLARTDPMAPKHLGITYFIVDMRRAEIEVRPLRELTGQSMFNEVFLSDVFVPDDCVIGSVNGGWPLARATLANERVAMGSGASFGGGIESLLGLVELLGGEAALDPVDVEQVGALVAESQTVRLLGHRATLRAVAGGGPGPGPGPETSVRKLLSAEHDQRTAETGLMLLGAEGATTEGVAAQWTFGFLANRCLTIAGGTSEVQRNVIGERILGLPRDPEPEPELEPEPEPEPEQESEPEPESEP